MKTKFLLLFAVWLTATGARAQYQSPSECSRMEYFDVAMWMCMPRAMRNMPMSMVMVHGQAFAVGTTEQGPRGRRAITGPDMVMFDVGHSLGDRHYFNLDFMGTAEKWTFPPSGTPLLLQIGEEDAAGRPYLDAQHPHSSPVMGLTLSDTISLGQQGDLVKVFFAPRGESTDGPVAFMHRPTGIVNPDAPLSHHVGQDVGHISGTVIGESLKLGDTRIEASTFHGAEPKPTAVDLPVDSPNSVALRFIEAFSADTLGMISGAYVRHPESSDPDLTSIWRASASAYIRRELSNDWIFHDALIYGLIHNYDHANLLSSIAEEFLIAGARPRFWGRLELLQRTPAELAVADATDQNSGRWVSEFTLGYSHAISTFDDAELDVGVSGTKDLLPGELIGPYGGNPWSGKLFVELRGMKMWNL